MAQHLDAAAGDHTGAAPKGAMTMLNAVPDCFWQVLQWHTAQKTGSVLAA
jgi:hypothetical protein